MIYCLSDLHLQPEQPAITQAFLSHLHWLNQQKPGQLYILGDLFEAWVGDDYVGPWVQTIIQALAKTCRRHEAFFIHGNRDFLLGQDFAHQVGLTLLPEIHSIEYNSMQITFCHGDHLCTQDLEYMQLRKMLRDPSWQAQFLQQSITKRLAIAKDLRQKSTMSNQHKTTEIMDVTPSAVDQCFHTTQCQVLIHGHTHRPNIHHRQHHNIRIVLGDWRPTASYLKISPVTFPNQASLVNPAAINIELHDPAGSQHIALQQN